MALLPDEAEVVELVQIPTYVMVPDSVELKVYAGVVSLVGVVTAVTSPRVGAVVSVVVVVVVSSLVVDAPSSLLLAQEMMVRLKRDMKIMYKTLFIFSFNSNERK